MKTQELASECSCDKILCCNMPSDKKTTQKRACVRPRFEELCAGIDSRRDLSCAHLLDTPDKMPGFLLKTINHCEAGGGEMLETNSNQGTWLKTHYAAGHTVQEAPHALPPHAPS